MTTKKTDVEQVDVEQVDVEQVESVEVESVDTLSEDIRLSLLRVVRNAVDPATDYGVDVTLAQNAADVYHKLFGEAVVR